MTDVERQDGGPLGLWSVVMCDGGTVSAAAVDDVRPFVGVWGADEGGDAGSVIGAAVGAVGIGAEGAGHVDNADSVVGIAGAGAGAGVAIGGVGVGGVEGAGSVIRNADGGELRVGGMMLTLPLLRVSA